MAWRWEPMANLPALIVPFKRPVYERVVQEFAKFAERVTLLGMTCRQSPSVRQLGLQRLELIDAVGELVAAASSLAAAAFSSAS